jgi:hypothetical protein
MSLPPNLIAVPAVIYEYLFCLPLSEWLWPPLDGRLRGYCRGLVPRVSPIVSYGPKNWIRLVPSSDRRLGNHTPRTGYGPTSPD